MKSRKNRMKGRYTNMKRDFLKDLGLEKEAIDSIMEENGKDIEAAKADVKSLESKISTLESDNATLKKQVEDRGSQLETLKNSTGDVEAMKTQIADLQKANQEAADAYAAEIKQMKIDAAIDSALATAKAKNVKAVKALLELGDDVDIDDKGVVKGLDEAIKKLQGAEDSKFLFEESKKTQVKGAKPGESGNEEGDHGVDTSKMTYSEMMAYLAENPDAQI